MCASSSKLFAHSASVFLIASPWQHRVNAGLPLPRATIHVSGDLLPATSFYYFLLTDARADHIDIEIYVSRDPPDRQESA